MGEATASKIQVIVAGEFAKAMSVVRALERDGRFTVIRCSDSAHDVFLLARKLLPCVVVVQDTLIDQIDAADLQALTGFGNFVQLLAVVDEQDDNARYDRLLRAGAMGAIEEDASPASFTKAVHTVARGEYWFARAFLSGFVREQLLLQSPRRLTNREKEILDLVNQKYTNRRIAEHLSISKETVRWHKRSIHAKMGMPGATAEAESGTALNSRR